MFFLCALGDQRALTHTTKPTPPTKKPQKNSRFQPVLVPEPTIDETYEILQGLRERYEAHHKLRYTDEALMAAAKYSSQYISDRFLPDKAIDLIDEAGSRVRLRHIQLPEEARELDKELKAVTKDKDAAVRGQDFEKAGQLRDREMELKAKISAVIAGAKEASKAEAESAEAGGPMVVEQDIANIVAQWTGIPIEKVSADETERLIKMEEVLHGRVIGQEEAVSAIARAIRRARVGLKNPNRPIASFIFAGPTGVGKSELAKTLASYYFGSEDAMVRGAFFGVLVGDDDAVVGARRRGKGFFWLRFLLSFSHTLRNQKTNTLTLSNFRCASTCRSSWSATPSPSSSARRPVREGGREGGVLVLCPVCLSLPLSCLSLSLSASPSSPSSHALTTTKQKKKQKKQKKPKATSATARAAS